MPGDHPDICLLATIFGHHGHSLLCVQVIHGLPTPEINLYCTYQMCSWCSSCFLNCDTYFCCPACWELGDLLPAPSSIFAYQFIAILTIKLCMCGQRYMQSHSACNRNETFFWFWISQRGDCCQTERWPQYSTNSPCQAHWCCDKHSFWLGKSLLQLFHQHNLCQFHINYKQK